jgi:hypothetical protein
MHIFNRFTDFMAFDTCRWSLYAVFFVTVGWEHCVPPCCQGWTSRQGPRPPEVQRRHQHFEFGKYTEIVGSNPTGGMDVSVCSVCVYSVST